MTCPRCQGFVYVDGDDTRCLACGYRPPLTPIVPVYRTTGSQCACGTQVADGTGVCRNCRYRDHAATVRAGMKFQRVCRRDTCEALCDPGLYYCGAHRPPRHERHQNRPTKLPVVQEAR